MTTEESVQKRIAREFARLFGDRVHFGIPVAGDSVAIRVHSWPVFNVYRGGERLLALLQTLPDGYGRDPMNGYPNVQEAIQRETLFTCNNVEGSELHREGWTLHELATLDDSLIAGRYIALATQAERGEWGLVKNWLARLEPDNALNYRAWLANDGFVEPADEDT